MEMYFIKNKVSNQESVVHGSITKPFFEFVDERRQGEEKTAKVGGERQKGNGELLSVCCGYLLVFQTF